MTLGGKPPSGSSPAPCPLGGWNLAPDFPHPQLVITPGCCFHGEQILVCGLLGRLQPPVMIAAHSPASIGSNAARFSVSGHPVFHFRSACVTVADGCSLSAHREARHSSKVSSPQFGCMWLCMFVLVSVIGRDSHCIHGCEVT